MVIYSAWNWSLRFAENLNNKNRPQNRRERTILWSFMSEKSGLDTREAIWKTIINTWREKLTKTKKEVLGVKEVIE